VHGATGEIQILDEACEGDYDLICIGSPHVVLQAERADPLVPQVRHGEAAPRREAIQRFVACRRFWSINLGSVRKLGTKRGGGYVDGTHFSYAGGQVRSRPSLFSYLGKGENRERYLGVKIPPSDLESDYGEPAQLFANGLADRLLDAGEPAARPDARTSPPA
jgi:hypothetical protein